MRNLVLMFALIFWAWFFVSTIRHYHARWLKRGRRPILYSEEDNKPN